MPFNSHSKHALRPAAIALSALLAAAPLGAAMAQSSDSHESNMAEHEARATAQDETVDQRIASLHEQLKITSAEESDWQHVANTMKENADAMAKLASQKANQSDMTAVQDLQTYSDFAQAHVAHLQKLTAAFSKLYDAMPEDQKKLADQVFQHSQHQEQDQDHKG
jgi:protein CpxP